MTFSLTINTANDAFKGNYPEVELARILRDLADQIVDGATSGRLRDVNGNRCGDWSFGPEQDGRTCASTASLVYWEPKYCRTCENCRHTFAEVDEEPCASCGDHNDDHSKWEPKP